jgi:hypothetical protein
MALEIVSITPKRVRVRISTLGMPSGREYTVDRTAFGSMGAIQAFADNGDRTTIGSFRIRDGSQMQPAYAKLRALLKAA